MATALKILSSEHQDILQAIDALLDECNSLQSGKKIDKIFFEQMIGFIRGYADKFHHAKEEDILFKEFNKCAAEGRTHCNPVEQMRHEHDLGRNFIETLEEGIKENDKNKIIAQARGYAQLLQEHIFKEDHILYPMADKALSQDVKDQMLEKFKQIEQESAQAKEGYLVFLKDLKKGQEGYE